VDNNNCPGLMEQPGSPVAHILEFIAELAGEITTDVDFLIPEGTQRKHM